MATVVQVLQSLTLLLPALDPDTLEDSLRDHAGLSAVRSTEMAQSPTVLACCGVAGHTGIKRRDGWKADDFSQKPPSEVSM